MATEPPASGRPTILASAAMPEPGEASSGPDQGPGHRPEPAAVPYLVVAALALLVALALASYLWVHRAEIDAVLRQVPT